MTRSGNRRLARSLALGFVLVALLLTGFLAAGAKAAQSASTPKIVVHTLEWGFEVQQASGGVIVDSGNSKKGGGGSNPLVIKAGSVIFQVTNAGMIEHNFIILDPKENTVAEIPVLAAQETAEIDVNLKPGEYTIICTYPGHRELGMVLALKVQ